MQRPMQDDYVADETNGYADVDEGDLSHTLVDGDFVGSAVALDAFANQTSALAESGQPPRASEAPAIEWSAAIPVDGQPSADTTVSSRIGRERAESTIVTQRSDRAESLDRADNRRPVEQRVDRAIALTPPVQPSATTEPPATREIGAAKPIGDDPAAVKFGVTFAERALNPDHPHDVDTVPPAGGQQRATRPEPAAAQSASLRTPPDVPAPRVEQQPAPFNRLRDLSRADDPIEQVIGEPFAATSVPVAGSPQRDRTDVRAPREADENPTSPPTRSETVRSAPESPLRETSRNIVPTPARTRWQGARSFVQSRLGRGLPRPQNATDDGATTTLPLHDAPARPVLRTVVRQAEEGAGDAPSVGIGASDQPAPPVGRIASEGTTSDIAQRHAATDASKEYDVIERDLHVAQDAPNAQTGGQEPRVERAVLRAPSDLTEQSVAAAESARRNPQSPSEPSSARGRSEAADAPAHQALSPVERAGRLSDVAARVERDDFVLQDASPLSVAPAGDSAAPSARLPVGLENPEPVETDLQLNETAGRAGQPRQPSGPTDMRRTVICTGASDMLPAPLSASEGREIVPPDVPISTTQVAPSLDQNIQTSREDAAGTIAQQPAPTQEQGDHARRQAAVHQSTRAEQAAPISDVTTTAGPPTQRLDDQLDQGPARSETPPSLAQSDTTPSTPRDIHANRAEPARQPRPTPTPFEQPTTEQTTGLPPVATSQPATRPRFVAPLPRAARTIAAWLKPRPTSEDTPPPIAEGRSEPPPADARDVLPVGPSSAETADIADQAGAAQHEDATQSIAFDHAVEPSLLTFAGESVPPTALSPDAVAPPSSVTIRPITRDEAQRAEPPGDADRAASIAPSPTQMGTNAGASNEPQSRTSQPNPSESPSRTGALAIPVETAATEPSRLAPIAAAPPHAVPPMVQSDSDDVHGETEINDAANPLRIIPPETESVQGDQATDSDVIAPPATPPSNQSPRSEATVTPPDVRLGDQHARPLVPPPVTDVTAPTPVADTAGPMPIARAESHLAATDNLTPEVGRHSRNDTEIPPKALSEPEPAQSPVAGVGTPQPKVRKSESTSQDTVAGMRPMREDFALQPTPAALISPVSIPPTAPLAEIAQPAERSAGVTPENAPLSDRQTDTVQQGDGSDADNQRAEYGNAAVQPAVEAVQPVHPDPVLRQRKAEGSVTAEHEQSDAPLDQSDTAPTQQFAHEVTPGSAAPVIVSPPNAIPDDMAARVVASDAAIAPQPPRTPADSAVIRDRPAESLPAPKQAVSAQAPSAEASRAIPRSPSPETHAESAILSPATKDVAASNAAPLALQQQDSVAARSRVTQPLPSLPVAETPNALVQSESIQAEQPLRATDAPPPLHSETSEADVSSVDTGSSPTEQIIPDERGARTAFDRAATITSATTAPDAEAQGSAPPDPAIPSAIQKSAQNAMTAPVDEAPRAVAAATAESAQPGPAILPAPEVAAAQTALSAPVPASAARDDAAPAPNEPLLPPSGVSQFEDAVPILTTIPPPIDQGFADTPTEQSPIPVTEVRQARRRPIVRARPQEEEPPPVLTAEEEAAEAAARARRARVYAQLRHQYLGDPIDDPATTPPATDTESRAAITAPAAGETPPAILPAAPAPLDRASDASALNAPLDELPSVAEPPAPVSVPPAPTRPVPVPEAVPTPVALPDATRRFLRPLVGFDPQTVPIYRDAETDRLTTERNADALTDGTAVVVASANLAAGRPETLGLLAHELTHVARQQRPRFVPPIARSEARATGEAMIAAERGGIRAASLTEESLAERVEERVIRAARAATAPPPRMAPSSSPPVGMEHRRDESSKRVQTSPTFNTDVAWGGLPAPWQAVPDWMREPPASPAPSVGDGPHDATAVSAIAPVVQRAGIERSLGGQQNDELPPHDPQGAHEGNNEPDLDALARQVYAILKNRLSVERRRIG